MLRTPHRQILDLFDRRFNQQDDATPPMGKWPVLAQKKSRKQNSNEICSTGRKRQSTITKAGINMKNLNNVDDCATWRAVRKHSVAIRRLLDQCQLRPRHPSKQSFSSFAIRLYISNEAFEALEVSRCIVVENGYLSFSLARSKEQMQEEILTSEAATDRMFHFPRRLQPSTHVPRR